MPDPKATWRSPWLWVPSLYLAEGIPYVMVMTVAGIAYKGLGISNQDIALYTGWLSLPWVIKPFWSPIVDILGMRRTWIWVMQLVIGGGLAGVALTLPATHFFQYSLAFFWLLAFSSATQDIAIDGFYMLAATEKEQAFFSGVRNLFFRIATIIGQGLLVVLVGEIQAHTRLSGSNGAWSWSIGFLLLAAVFLGCGIGHRWLLPHPLTDKPRARGNYSVILREFFLTFGDFFKKNRIVALLAFLLFYRFAEAQLVKIVPLFLLDSRRVGGLGLTTTQVGVAYGTVGVIALSCGGILGGMLVARNGLKYWLWWMVLAIHLPDAVFVYLAWAQPDNLGIINICVAIEQFGYGFGFTAYMLYMIYIARGEHQTAYYAICTGFMALGMMSGTFSGWLQEAIGYRHFFVWVMLATIPGFFVAWLIPLDAEFGRDASARRA